MKDKNGGSLVCMGHADIEKGIFGRACGFIWVV